MTVVLSSCLFLFVISVVVHADVAYGCRLVVNCVYYHDTITSPDHAAICPRRYSFLQPPQ
jgi:hypothetical protein